MWYVQLKDLEAQLQENLCKKNSIETYSEVDEVIVKMELLLLSDMYCTSIIPLYLKEKSDKTEEHILQSQTHHTSSRRAAHTSRLSTQ